MDGKEVLRKNIRPNEGSTIPLNVEHLPQGIYNYSINSYSNKFIKE